MRNLLLLFLISFLVSSCSEPLDVDPPTNRWADAALWPVLEAQEHRNTDTLCTLLADRSATVREAAALAFASVQDSASIPCLLKALHDDAVEVRATAAFALGFIADSSTVQRMAEWALQEKDRRVQRALLNASFIAMQRNGLLKEPSVALYYMEHSTGHEQLRAADALRRLPDSSLNAIQEAYLNLFAGGIAPDVEAMLIRGLWKLQDPEAKALLRSSTNADKPALIIPSAIGAIGSLKDPVDDSLLFRLSGADMIGQASIDVLLERATLDPRLCLLYANGSVDQGSKIILLGLAMKHATHDLADSLLSVVKTVLDTSSSAYQRAAMIRAFRYAPGRNPAADLLEPLITSANSSLERITAFQAAMDLYGDKTTGQVELIHHTLDTSNDPGLITAVCEAVQQREVYFGNDIRFLPRLEEKKGSFQLPRDLEALLAVESAIAFLNGRAQPAHRSPPFNNPIDPVKLRALPQDQRYRITTAKGEIVIATDVDDCPGSSLAFDSLVTAGYYNGKAFHRMVPNFVVQGGCPRGDGYGGMPWTLRTEIGRKLFTAGSVGLASAGRDTESCQFFVTHSATPHLDGRYTRFGEVVQGMDIVWRLQVGDVMEKVERID